VCVCVAVFNQGQICQGVCVCVRVRVRVWLRVIKDRLAKVCVSVCVYV
jgi:hypothetical protein